MNVLAKIWRDHGTKVLGYMAGVIPAALLIEGLVPASQHKYWNFVLLLISGGVVRRGHTNGKASQ